MTVEVLMNLTCLYEQLPLYYCMLSLNSSPRYPIARALDATPDGEAGAAEGQGQSQGQGQGQGQGGRRPYAEGYAGRWDRSGNATSSMSMISPYAAGAIYGDTARDRDRDIGTGDSKRQ
jgi:hypothetical protein